MGTKHKHLYEKIYNIDNLRNAYKKAARGGNKYTIGNLKFQEDLEANLYALQQALINETYVHGPYSQFEVYEPKKRIINALPFADRVVQHAINNIIEPIFDNVFYSCTYACRKNKGTHAGVRAVQSTMRQMEKEGEVFFLKMDFSKYYASIDRGVLFTEIERKISDKKVIALLETFGDRHGVGIPIGNLLSQLCANLYGHIFDRHIKEELGLKHYFRYMDDTVILSHDKDHLKELQHYLESFAKTHMKLKFSHWMISSVHKQVNFLGYRIAPSYKLMRKDSVTRAKRKVKRYIANGERENLRAFLASWHGHVQTADSHNLKSTIRGMYEQCAA
jgi:retron-type reverse transcriptase